MLSAALIACALLAGVAGSWSPCGLSMIETLGRARVATVTFAVGALAGGAITFGGLALLGSSLAGPVVALAIAALVVAALGDAAGRRIVPQVRRQVPESWRRFAPLPLATGLYGVLLGLGFTTFLLTYATWALAAACLAVGTAQTGLLVGLAFGAGRALPVAVLALRADGAAVLAERPAVLRGLRGATAVALTAAAAVLLAAPPAARAATAESFAISAADPSASPDLLAYQPNLGQGVLVRGKGERIALPGTHPAVAGTRVAWLSGEQIVLADAATLTPLVTIPAPGADALALSGSYVAWRAGRSLWATGIDAAGPAILVARARGTGSLGRPSLEGSTVTYDQQSSAGSRIASFDAASGQRRRLRSATGALLLAPTVVDGRLLYVRSTFHRQQLVLNGRVVYSTAPTARRDNGEEPGLDDHAEDYGGGKVKPPDPPRPPAGYTATLWTTALRGDAAYVTVLRDRRGATGSRILRIAL